MVLRGEAISTSILVIGYTSSENIKNCRLKNIAFTITSLEQLQTVVELVQRPTKIHLKIDTGMHRQGILLEQTAAAIELIKANNYLILEGLCSHLADADGADENFTLQQIERWNKIVNEFEHAFSVIKYVHLAASAGAFYLERARGNVARLGLALYGVNPSAKNSLDLQPALQIESVISSVKKIPAGEGVGYNLTHVLKETGLVATVPVGYYEAVDRRLSNIGSFLVNGQVCPIVGRVSMNITIIDVTALPEIKLGDSVVVTSWDPEAKNSLENQARLAGTIPYELMVHITPHLHREVV
jgi:alanine racemase